MAWGISSRKYAFATPTRREEMRMKSGKMWSRLKVGIFVFVAIIGVL
jgi:hypothetical protein